jgi:hypothetical protein
MTTTFKARSKNGKLVPQERVDLPDGQLFEVRIRPTGRSSKRKTALQRLAQDLAKCPPASGLPRDLAAQHDHYLYGTPKRRRP